MTDASKPKKPSLKSNEARREVRAKNKREMKAKMAKEKKRYIPTWLDKELDK